MSLAPLNRQTIEFIEAGVRDPGDTAVSNYRQLFSNGNGFAYGQDNFVRYIQAYAGLTERWRDHISRLVDGLGGD